MDWANIILLNMLYVQSAALYIHLKNALIVVVRLKYVLTLPFATIHTNPGSNHVIKGY